jgi:kanamycin kinase
LRGCPSCGHVDLGTLGVADRWADLAVATLSLSWNYPGSWDGELLEAYGVDPDPARIEYSGGCGTPAISPPIKLNRSSVEQEGC